MSNKISQKQGFTIIEVVLVLAIAGLIFLMVFVAFPALQRNQRDTQRREDYSQLQAAVISAYSNDGVLPADDADSELWEAIGNNGRDPENTEYTVGINTATASGYTAPSLTRGNVFVIKNAQCNNNGQPQYTTDATQFAIFVFFLGGSYCRSARAR